MTDRRNISSTTDLERCRRLFEDQAWLQVFECLTSVDQNAPLGVEDLERCATSAYMLGRDDAYVEYLQRAHQAYLNAGDVSRAAKCGFWIGHSFMFRGERVQATGWFARSERLLGRHHEECVGHGYLLVPVWLAHIGRGGYDDGYATAAEAVSIGERFGDADLVWLARDDQARALLGLGRVEEGLRMVDEVMVAATTGELSPIVTGIIYCNTIDFCRAALQVRHVRAWTRALTGWCERQPEMVAHNGVCLVHRAEIMLLSGDWGPALDEAGRSIERSRGGALNRSVCGKAYYCQGEAHRLQGNFRAAEEAYRQASRNGCEPQPGLALMRLAEGNVTTAVAAIRRITAESTSPATRAGILPAYVEIMLADGNLESALAACRELDEIADHLACEFIDAMAAHSRGSVSLAEGNPIEALSDLRAALAVWRELSAAYEVARVQMLVGTACQALGDEDTAALELEAARIAFAELGARHDRMRVEYLTKGSKRTPAHRLTARQVQVLRLLASGMSNREIADQLYVSEHTVARHVQNIFARLDVSSRTAATAFAFENDLV